MIFRNSELQKCYWQSFSFQRIVAMPLVILAVIVLIILTQKDNYLSALGMINSVAYQGFYAVVFLWGCYQAANALVQEVKENTWDNQRLSSVSPTELAIGKLFGSTMYTWYGAIILLGAYFSTGTVLNPVSHVLFNVIMMVGAGLLAQAVALLASLVPIRMHSGRDKLHVIAFFFCGLLASGPFLASLYHLSFSYTGYRINDHETIIKWFQMDVSQDAFFVASLVLFLFWTLWAICRFMRDALKFRNTPVVWGLFLAFCMVYFAGLLSPYSFYVKGSGMLMGAFIVGIAATFISFFLENLNILRYRALFYQWRTKNWNKLAHLFPMWVVSYLLTGLVGVALMAVFLGDPEKLQGVFAFVASCLLFVLRDTAIFHYFMLVPNGRLPLLATLFYLGILYLLIPNIIFGMGFDREQIGFVFYPSLFNPTDKQMIGTVFHLLPIVLELAIVGWLLKWRYQKINALIEQ